MAQFYHKKIKFAKKKLKFNMAYWNDKSIKLGDYKFFLILLSHMLITFVDGRGVDQFMKNRELPMHEGTIKTIEVINIFFLFLFEVMNFQSSSCGNIFAE